MRVSVFDYGAGNLHSLVKALEAGGAQVVVSPDPVAALAADALVLPGVGAFGAAAARLAAGRSSMRDAVASGLPCLGICLGMQLLLEGSDEGDGAGLGLVPGRVTRLAAARVPHMGWNAIEEPSDPLFAKAPLREAYYANSFVCRPLEPAAVTAWSRHEDDRFAAAVRVGRAVGVQFHPEKSSAAGVAWLAAWLAEVRR
ncbi:MAG: imidazole glycerol phosphate synthase subunit HisH [bacterium]